MSNILVVEDNLLIRELVREILEREHFQVQEACDGNEALEKIEIGAPDLVLMDIQLPRLDGYAVLDRLRHDRRFSRLPVIALTAYAMRSDHEKALRAGFDNYLTKPIDRPALIEMIRSFLTQERPLSKTRAASNPAAWRRPATPPRS